MIHFKLDAMTFFINASSSKPSTEHRQGDLPQVAYLSACQLCNFSGAFTIVESPFLKWAKVCCVSACIWADLWVLQSPQPENGPSCFTTRTMVVGATTSPHHPPFWFHSHSKLSLYPIMLSALEREQRRSFIKCVTSPRGFVLTGGFFL